LKLKRHVVELIIVYFDWLWTLGLDGLEGLKGLEDRGDLLVNSYQYRNFQEERLWQRDLLNVWRATNALSAPERFGRWAFEENMEEKAESEGFATSIKFEHQK
jgi:hypothetical protein